MKATVKVFLLAAVLAVMTTSAARAESPPPVGYVDLGKAIGDTAAGKAAVATANAAQFAHRSEFDAAKTDAKKAEIAQRSKADAQQQLDQATAPILDRAHRLLPKIAAEHKLTAGIQSSATMLYVPPKLDYTAELTKRLDAGEGKTDEEAQAELQRKNQEQAREIAELRSKVAEAKKPEATTPAAPPIAPRPTVAKK